MAGKSGKVWLCKKLHIQPERAALWIMCRLWPLRGFIRSGFHLLAFCNQSANTMGIRIYCGGSQQRSHGGIVSPSSWAWSPVVLRASSVTCGSSFHNKHQSFHFSQWELKQVFGTWPFLQANITFLGGSPHHCLLCGFLLFFPMPATNQLILATEFWSGYHTVLITSIFLQGWAADFSLCRRPSSFLSPKLQSVHFLTLCLYLQALCMKFILVVCLVFSFTTKEQKTLLDLFNFFLNFWEVKNSQRPTVLNKSNYTAFLWLSKTQSN